MTFLIKSFLDFLLFLFHTLYKTYGERKLFQFFFQFFIFPDEETTIEGVIVSLQIPTFSLSGIFGQGYSFEPVRENLP